MTPAEYRAALVEAIARALWGGELPPRLAPAWKNAEAALAVVETAAPPCATCGGTTRVVAIGGNFNPSQQESFLCPDCQGSRRSPLLYMDLMRGAVEVHERNSWTVANWFELRFPRVVAIPGSPGGDS